MSDPKKFPEEIFGFHVQQAVEKTLKAWLCCVGAAFPKIHDLEELAALLDQAHQELPTQFAELLDYTDFAVMFRYEAFSELEVGIDRERTIVLVEELVHHVAQMFHEAETAQ
jgi:HEPN domain-containing protein